MENHERGGRSAIKHRETEAIEKSKKWFQTPSLVTRKGKEKMKMPSQDKPDGPGQRWATLAAE
jgi:hypothetical protein